MSREEDETHLRLLSIFHYVVGGIGLLFSLFPLIHVTIGLMMVFNPEIFNNGQGGSPPPAFIGWIFAIAGMIGILLGTSLSIVIIFSGRYLTRRKHYTYCFVTACIECLIMPFGTLLGVFSILVLSRSSVKEMFNQANRSSVDNSVTG